MWNISIRSIDRTLSGTTTSGQCGPGSDGHGGFLSILQSSKTRASPSEDLFAHGLNETKRNIPVCLITLVHENTKICLNNGSEIFVLQVYFLSRSDAEVLLPSQPLHVWQLLDKSKHISKEWKIEKVLFTNPSARAGYDTRSIFKRSLTGLNSEFSFS